MEQFINSLSSIFSDSIDEPYRILLPIALILLLGKCFSVLLGKLKVPEVIGYLLAGLAIGLFYLIPNNWVLDDFTVSGINDLAKIGVVLILFTAGMETNLRMIKKEGLSSLIITLAGVIVPLGLGTLSAFVFRVFGCEGTTSADWYANLTNPTDLGGMGVNGFYSDLYYGIILSATSISISVATLKGLGKLEGPMGTALTSAAILDDIIGVILLSVVISLSGAKETSYAWVIPIGEGGLSILWLVLEMIAFFGITIGVGLLVHKAFNAAGKRWPHKRRLSMFAIAFALLWAFVAECFHVADITGAFFAGIIIGHTSQSEYIEHRAETTENVFFTPIFFASVALKMYTSLGADGSESSSSFSAAFIFFGLIWVVCGLLGKVIGAGVAAKIRKFSWKESAAIGIGMMARAEVLIVTAQEGIDAGLVESSIMPFCLAMILVSSFAAPIFIRLLFRKDSNTPDNGEQAVAAEEIVLDEPVHETQPQE